MIIRLESYGDMSCITLYGTVKQRPNRHMGSIVYISRAHKYFAEIDYKTLATEHNTYGDKALQETFDYLQATRRRAPYTA